MTAGATVTLPSDFVDQVAQRVIELLALQAPTAQQPESWLTVNQAADYLACERQRIYNLTSQRRLQYAKDGSRVLFRRQWLDDYLEAIV